MYILSVSTVFIVSLDLMVTMKGYYIHAVYRESVFLKVNQRVARSHALAPSVATFPSLFSGLRALLVPMPAIAYNQTLIHT